jgi:REP element-mobilizing transposase RayT
MVRGNERKNLFMDEEDKTRYIETLSRVAGHSSSGIKTTRQECPVLHTKKEKEFSLYAYCLMDNHVHLIINEEEDEISRIMKRIGSSYAYYFNKKYSRVGHLFQDRFKSEAIENDSYLLAAVRYIHNNPVRACLVKHASEYKWSSYHEYVSENSLQKLLDRDKVLEMLSGDRGKAIKLFVEYSNQENRDAFLEVVEAEDNKALKSTVEVMKYVQEFLEKKNIGIMRLNDKENLGIRNELIYELKCKSNLSIRQIAEHLKVNRGVVQRVKV